MSTIEGLFEIHISVDNKNLVDFIFFCKRQNYKVICAASGKGMDNTNFQCMLSKFTSGDSVKAIQRALDIQKQIEEEGIRVIRTKVEAMLSNKGVPQTKEDEKHFPCSYAEFHVKFALRNNENLSDLENTAKKVASTITSECDFSVACSINILGKSGLPLLTIRILDSWKEEAIRIKDGIMDGLKEFGYKSNDGIQQEWAFYDTNVEMDDGWI